jgi:hypothetical protein
MEKLQLTDKVRSHLAQFFKKELKTCAAKLGGPARQWPARYGFSLLYFFAELIDNFDLFSPVIGSPEPEYSCARIPASPSRALEALRSRSRKQQASKVVSRILSEIPPAVRL